MNEFDEHRHEMGVVITALQNDCDRDVRYLVSQLPGITDVTPDKGDRTVCVILFLLLVCYVPNVAKEEYMRSV